MGRVPGARRQGAELIEYIDEQKQYGHVAYATSTQDTVYMSLTRYGVKVTDVNEEVRTYSTSSQEVFVFVILLTSHFSYTLTH